MLGHIHSGGWGGGGGGGWRRSGYGGGYYSGVPGYALLAPSNCACQQQSTTGTGLESWVKTNPMLALIGVFALGLLAGKKKGGF